MLRDGVKAAPPAAHPIRIQRSCFRCHPDDHEFRLRVDVDELPVDAERNLNAAITVDAIPLAAITAVREDLGARRMGGAQRYPSRFSMLAYRHERRSSQLHCRGPFLRHRQMSRITREILASGRKAAQQGDGFRKRSTHPTGYNALSLAARRMGGAQRYPSRFSMLAYRHERRSSQLHRRGPFLRRRRMSRITRAVARLRSKVMGFASAQPILRAGREQDELRFLARRSYGAAGGQEVRLVVPPTIQPRGSRRCLSA
jgi:hypothetical protein